MNPGEGASKLRVDIQCLRAVAVVTVILFHANPVFAKSGFLGVDIFFVISGFLMTSIIAKSFDQGTFSFLEFYSRRIRRLLPAAYTVLLFCIVAATLLLTKSAMKSFVHQLFGSLSFTTNIVLWKQINYFNTSADFEPLLHMWSLAVEEQFYLFFPFLFLWIPRRLWLVTVSAIVVLSATIYTTLYLQSPGFTFYMLPTRAWEMGLGSVAAFVTMKGGATIRMPYILVAWLSVIAVPFARAPVTTGYLLVLPVCVATAVLLVGNYQFNREHAAIRLIAKIGDMSYSLYLVHWPLFAFARVLFLKSHLPLSLTLVLLAAVFLLAWLLYRFIEEPIRLKRFRPRFVLTAALGASGAIVCAGVAAQSISLSRPGNIDLNPVYGLNAIHCQGASERMDVECSEGTAPTMLIWGDSLSQALTPFIDQTTSQPLLQASRGQCAPIVGLAPFDLDSLAMAARACIEFNDSVLKVLSSKPSIQVVVLTGNYFRYLQPGTKGYVRLGSGEYDARSIDARKLADLESQTVRRLRQMGKRVVIVSPPPLADFDVGQCWERRRSGLPTIAPVMAGMPACAITRNNQPSWVEENPRLMQLMAQRSHAPLVDLSELFCSGGVCRTSIGDTPVYRDAMHLSGTGAALLSRKARLGDILFSTAR